MRVSNKRAAIERRPIQRRLDSKTDHSLKDCRRMDHSIPSQILNKPSIRRGRRTPGHQIGKISQHSKVAREGYAITVFDRTHRICRAPRLSQQRHVSTRHVTRYKNFHEINCPHRLATGHATATLSGSREPPLDQLDTAGTVLFTKPSSSASTRWVEPLRTRRSSPQS